MTNEKAIIAKHDTLTLCTALCNWLFSHDARIHRRDAETQREVLLSVLSVSAVKKPVGSGTRQRVNELLVVYNHTPLCNGDLKMFREYGAWYSTSLSRKMEFLWFGQTGKPVLIFPTSMGRFHQNEDFGLTSALADKMDAGEIQLVCVDSVDEESWYNKNIHPADRARRHDQYDHYLRNELIPYAAARSHRDDLVAYGASFGAYHAANLAARFPELIRKAILFSGLYDIHRYLGGYWDDTCYFHCPTAYIPNLDESWIKRLAQVTWIIATGEHDSLIQDNRQFAALLESKGIPRHAEFWPGVFGHDWPWWKENLRRFLP
jgi:esterase/lipase superfamily enzyme